MRDSQLTTIQFLERLEINFKCEEYERQQYEDSTNTKSIGTGKNHFRPKLIFKNGAEILGSFWTTVTDIPNTEEAYTEFYLNKSVRDFLKNYNTEYILINIT